MNIHLVSVFFKLAFQRKVVMRGLKVALVVGVVLNVINQGDHLLLLEFGQINFLKFVLTFFVPYLVSSYSSVMAKMHFEVGEIAPMNAILKCKDCEDEVVHINKGETIPDCSICSGNTQWKIIERGVANPKEYAGKAESMALFAEFNPAPVFRFDAQGTILTSNPAADHFFGDESIDGRDVHQILKNFVSFDFQNIIDKGEIKSFVAEIGSKAMRFELRGIPKLGVCQVYGADITSALKVKLENKRLSAAVEQTSNSVMITNKKGEIVFVNKAFEKITGYSANEVDGRNPRFLKTGEMTVDTYQKMWKTIADGKVWKGEFHNKRKDNQLYWEEATISPVLDEKGEIVNYMAVKEDITERKRTRFELRSMAMFAEMNPEPVFRLGLDGKVVKANTAANISFDMESLEGAAFVDILPDCSEIDLVKIIESGEIITVEEHIHKGIFRFILRGLPELEVCQIYGSDVTLRRKAEEKVKRQNESIAHSIKYASRIQNAILPKSNKINALMPEHFIFFKPRDVVSGDFYWMAQRENKLIVAIADCTGHGVPGAFMSMLGIASLNEIVNKNNEESANEILNQLRDNIKLTLAQTDSVDAAKDGMDMALCVIDYEHMLLNYSGAYNPLILIRDNELIQYKADKMPIGVHIKEKPSFTNHEIKIQKGDMLYMYSDGFVDQFGGDKNYKFSSKRFKELLMQVHGLGVDAQYEKLDNEFSHWKGSISQIDDVLVFGGKV